MKRRNWAVLTGLGLFLGTLLLGLLALTAVVALQVVGVILVVAMLIIPGATAYLLTDRFGRMLLIAPTMSVLCSVLGIFLSYWLDAAPGGLVVVIQGAAFALVYLFSPRHGLIGRRIIARRAGRAVPAAEWFALVDAPSKEWIVFDHSGHRPSFEEPAAFAALMERVKVETEAAAG